MITTSTFAYKGQFMADDGELVQVRIECQNLSEDKELTFGPDPMHITFGSDDIFEGASGKTMTLQVVTDEDMDELITEYPLGCAVKVQKGSNDKFFYGFLSISDFDIPSTGYKQTVTIECVDPINALSAIPYPHDSSDKREVLSMYKMLGKICELVDINDMYIDQTYYSVLLSEDAVLPADFDADTDDNDWLSAGDVLKYIGSSFSMAIFVEGTTLYAVSTPTEGTWYVMPVSKSDGAWTPTYNSKSISNTLFIVQYDPNVTRSYISACPYVTFNAERAEPLTFVPTPFEDSMDGTSSWTSTSGNYRTNGFNVEESSTLKYKYTGCFADVRYYEDGSSTMKSHYYCAYKLSIRDKFARAIADLGVGSTKTYILHGTFKYYITDSDRAIDENEASLSYNFMPSNAFSVTVGTSTLSTQGASTKVNSSGWCEGEFYITITNCSGNNVYFNFNGDNSTYFAFIKDIEIDDDKYEYSQYIRSYQPWRSTYSHDMLFHDTTSYRTPGTADHGRLTPGGFYCTSYSAKTNIQTYEAVSHRKWSLSVYGNVLAPNRYATFRNVKCIVSHSDVDVCKGTSEISIQERKFVSPAPSPTYSRVSAHSSQYIAVVKTDSGEQLNVSNGESIEVTGYGWYIAVDTAFGSVTYLMSDSTTKTESSKTESYISSLGIPVSQTVSVTTTGKQVEESAEVKNGRYIQLPYNDDPPVSPRLLTHTVTIVCKLNSGTAYEETITSSFTIVQNNEEWIPDDN